MKGELMVYAESFSGNAISLFLIDAVASVRIAIRS